MNRTSFGAIASVAYKEFLHIYRDRRVLLLLLILPPLFTLLFGQAFETSEIKDIPALLINRDNTAQTQRFVDIILKNKTFRWRQASPDVANESDLLGNRVRPNRAAKGRVLARRKTSFRAPLGLRPSDRRQPFRADQKQTLCRRLKET